MPRVKRTPETKRDTAEIWRFIAERSFDAAERWLSELDREIKLLAIYPGAGRLREELGLGLRSYPLGRYLIFYRPIPGGIEIVRVLHGARNLRRIFKRRR